MTFDQQFLKLAMPKRNRGTAFIFSGIIGLLVSSTAMADDISVYGLEAKAPQILFTLDYSLSMERLVGTKTRIEVLRETVLELMDNYKDSVEFGIGPMFAVTGGGVQWPVSDLRLDASYIDDSIEPGKKTAFEVVESIINNTPLEWGTATVPALAESVQYFRGGPVGFGDNDGPNTLGFKPLAWDNTLGQFLGYSSLIGNSAAYTPRNAYSVGTAPGSTGYCRQMHDQTGRKRAVSDCRYLPATYTVSNCVPAPEGFSLDGYEYDSRRYEFDVCEYQHDDQWSGANYISPIENECQSNLIIMVSDGEPVNNLSNASAQAIFGDDVSSCEDLSTTVLGTPGAPGKEAGNCAPEIAEFIANNDQIPGNEKSRIITHTVGFGIGSKGSNYLARIAAATGDIDGDGVNDGEYHSAENATQLFSALDELIAGALPEAQQFSNFSVDVDRAAFSHDNRAYVPLFNPSDAQSWVGNIKGYFIGEDGLEDVDGNPAMDTTTTVAKFNDTARSFWSPSADGNMVQEGGASGKLDPESRNLYTYRFHTVNNRIELSNSVVFELSKDNPLLLPHDFGYANRVDAPALLDWIREQPMGEPLHSNTAIINYADGERVIYAMTNQGFLHAIDASTPVVTGDYTGGEEIFAFMPYSLLRNIEYMKNGGFVGEHIYGLDGSITPWHTDHNNDGIVNETDTMIIVFGMRRGGNHYYAMDVTDPERPALVWQISGDNDWDHPDFVDLAQTWSEPQLITVKSSSGDQVVNIDGADVNVERVMVFGGGYDDSVDDIHAPTASKGNTIFMVDSDGEYIWSAAHDDMDYGIPSDLRVIDSDGDGLADRMYAGDLGGQVWRVDFDDVQDTTSFDITKFADLSSYGYQPFFYPPSVSRDAKTGNLFVAIGSGNRDNPIKDLTEGAIYMLQDNYPDKGAPAATFNTITNGSLANITEKARATPAELEEKSGWVIDLDEGEKSLSSVVTINGDLLATTFRPATESFHDGCGVPPAEKRLYVVNVADGGPPNNANATEFTTEPVSRYIEIEVGGIPPEPYTIFPKDSETIDVYVGYEKQLELDQTISTVFWYEK